MMNLKTLLAREQPLGRGGERSYLVEKIGDSNRYRLRNRASNDLILDDVSFDEIKGYLDARNKADGRDRCIVNFFPDPPEEARDRIVRCHLLDENLETDVTRARQSPRAGDLFMNAISLQALMTVIERHKLVPVNNEYQLTNEMLAEAAAIDERRGTGPSPEKLRELQAVVEGRGGPGWEMVKFPPDD
jgi:hypothetical protein